MPTCHVAVLERRAGARKKRTEEIAGFSVAALGGTPEVLDILITGVRRDNWATGGHLPSART